MLQMRTLAAVFFALIAITSLADPPSHEPFTRLLKQHVTKDGKVNYKGFVADSAALSSYLRILSMNPPERTWSRAEQMAYWINAYNAFTIQLVIKYYPIKSIKDIGSSIQVPFVNTPWDIKFIQIGKDRLDLNNIEHGILRKRFYDPRIHMALVCASKSCPILLNEAYEPSKLEVQLTRQTKSFLDDLSRNQISGSKPRISMIFKWYGTDFNDVKAFINQYSSVKINERATIEYLEYDWLLNE